jgi:hypothetical protein
MHMPAQKNAHDSDSRDLCLVLHWHLRNIITNISKNYFAFMNNSAIIMKSKDKLFADN